jgi:Family of unknown function (DUF6152)
VKEYRYTSPHTFIILDVKDKDGSSQLWNLEGGAPSGLIRDGWSSKTLKPGDELCVERQQDQVQERRSDRRHPIRPSMVIP